MHPPSPPPLSQGMGALLDIAVANAQEKPPGTPHPGCRGLCHTGMAGAPCPGAQGEVWLLKAGVLVKAFFFLIGL